MKRHSQPDEDETPEASHQTKTRRISPTGRRVSDEEGSGDLDLNATPLGFDLNAPVEEEDVLQANNNWLSSHQDLENKAEIDEALRINSLPSEASSLDQSKAETVPLVGHDSVQAVIKSEDVYEPRHPIPDEDPVGLSPKEEEGSDQGESPSVKAEEIEDLEEKPQVTVPAVFCRPFEPLNLTASDEELEILRSVWSAWQQEDVEALDMTMADTLEELGKHALNPNRYLLLSSIYVAKKLPEAFSLPRTVKVLLTFLESAAAQTVVKRQSLLPMLACKLLFRAFAGEPDWPIEFVQVYLLDSTGSRAWIDHEGCKEFVSNVLTAFPDSVLDVSEDTTGPKSSEQVGTGDSQQIQGVKAEGHGMSAIKNRYSQGEMQQKVRAEFCQSLNQLLGAAMSKENPRQLIRLLMQGAGFEEVRVVASSMLEGWLNNPVHLRSAKTLLDRILQHTRGTSENDFNTVANLLALRVSSTQAPGQIKTIHNNIFSEMITQLVRRRPEYATLALKTFVTTELQSKNPHNIKSIITVLKAVPSEDNPPEYELANILQELAASDESRGLLCDFVRRMMKQAGGEFDVHALCHGLIQPWPLMAEQEESLKEAWINKLVDLTCQLLLHAAAPFVEDEGLFNTVTSSSHLGTTSGTSVSGFGLERSSSGGPLRDKLATLEKLSIETQNFQMQAMAWCTDVLALYLPHIGHAHFKKIVRQLLFLEEAEAYFSHVDPAMDAESKCVKLLGACTRAPEEIVARLILMGISNFPMEPAESLDIIEVLVCRAAKLERFMEGSLVASSSQLPAAIFKLASFNLRGVTRQPLPQLVVKDMYWKACLVVLIVAVFNLTTIGNFVWESIPSLRSLMEVLIAGDKAFRSNSCSEASQLEFEKTEADAEQLDMKAEEAVKKNLAEKKSSESSMVDGDDLESSETEWKGKLMILNHSGPIRRPTQVVYDKLNKLDEMFQLGHLLRKCRNPDFFSKVTALQTMQQAWPWLQSIVSREPEVIFYLPTAWQCELLYMLEGSHPTTQMLSVDLLQLQAELRETVTTPSNEKEIETIIGFLAQKLMAKQFSVRSRARRCLSSLFHTTPKQHDTQVSLPPSPREHKRTDTASGITSRWPVHAMDTAQPHHSKKLMVGSSGTSSLHVSPGISSGLVVATSSAERIRAFSQYSGFEDYTAWLTSLESLPTASRLIAVLLPSIQVAIQQETSVSVVVAYLEFLKKHASPLPSQQSMACILATFIMQRKMLTASLLSGPSTLPSAFVSACVESKSHSNIVDLILESLCEALETGTHPDSVTDEAASHSHMVTLASPRNLGNEQVVRRVNLQKVVVDASLKVLSLLALKHSDVDEEKQGFSRLLSILFPDTQFSVAWLEGRKGEKLPLLSEDQALLFARCNVAKLIRAGLAALSLRSKLDLCEKLSLSSTAATALLQDLDAVSQVRLEAELGPRGSFCRHAKKLQKCVRALMQPGNPSGVYFSGFLDAYAPPAVRDVSQPQILLPPSKLEYSDDVARNDSGNARALTGEELANQLIIWLKLLPVGTFSSDRTNIGLELTKTSPYLDFRHTVQQALLCANDDNESTVVSSVTACVRSLESLHFHESLLLILPILNILQRINSRNLQELLSAFISRIETGVEANNLYDRILNQKIIFKKKNLLQMNELKCNESSTDQLVRIVKNLTLRKFSQVPLHRIERILRYALSAKLNYVPVNSEDGVRQVPEGAGSEYVNETLILEMLDLLRAWKPNRGNVHKSLDLKEQVELVGRCALVCEYLMFLDPEFLSTSHLSSLFEDSFLYKNTTVFSIPKLALDLITLRSSWQSISRILKVILGVFVKQNEGIREGKIPDTSEATSARFVREEVREDPYLQKVPRREVFDEAGSILEFILLCVRHPRTILACRLNDELDPFGSTKTILSSFDHGLEEALATIAIADLMVARSSTLQFHHNSDESDYSGKFSLSTCVVDQPALVSSSRAMQVLLVAACQGKRFLSTIIEQLNRVGQGSFADVLFSLNSKSEAKESTRKAAAVAAQELLAGLYVAFPVSVRTVLQSLKDKKCQAIDLSSLLQDHKFISRTFTQTCTLNNTLHRALRSICKGCEKEAKAAYGFCHDMARQHPALLVPHLPTFSVLLKEMLPSVKLQDTQIRTTVARTYTLGISLLDALRPYLLADNQNNLPMSSRKASLEAMLGFYFEFLQCLEIPDRPQFAKVVARLADFLCHCVDAGGFYRDYVLSYRTPVLQTCAQTFHKIKKLGFLLGMLDKPVQTWANTVPKSSSSADEGKTSMGGNLIGPPSLPLEDVLKVRTQLLQCIRWQGSKKPQDSRLELFNTRVNSYSVWYEMKGLDVEEVNLTATLLDLERASARMPMILSALEDSLLELTDVSDSNVRDRAYVLLERLLLHCPSESSATNILQRLLQQLSSSDTSLAKTAARQAVRFFYYCSEFQETILVEMLQMGRFASEDLQQLLLGLFTVSGGPLQ